jgi:hypothetical protein
MPKSHDDDLVRAPASAARRHPNSEEMRTPSPGGGRVSDAARTRTEGDAHRRVLARWGPHTQPSNSICVIAFRSVTQTASALTGQSRADIAAIAAHALDASHDGEVARIASDELPIEVHENPHRSVTNGEGRKTHSAAWPETNPGLAMDKTDGAFSSPQR